MSRAYLIQRTAASIGILLGVSILIFAAVRLVPGDPISLMLGRADLSDAALVAEFRKEYLLDEPLPLQYGAWVLRVASGDFGRSLDSQEPVGDILGRRIQATLVLASLGALLGLSAGVLWGVAAASLGGIAGRVLRAAPMVLMSVPAYSLGIAIGFTFAAWLRLFPSSGMVSPVDGGGVLDVLRHSVLPAFTLAILPASLTARITAGTLDELRNEDFVRTARAVGLPPRRIALRHVLPNAMLPVITNGGILVGGMFTSAVFVEAVFGWPGVGTMMVRAAESRDYPTLQAGAFVVASVFVLINWFVDTLYSVVDPRIRSRDAVAA
jgi:peptide/nickel transport system permease protein